MFRNKKLSTAFRGSCKWEWKYKAKSDQTLWKRIDQRNTQCCVWEKARGFLSSDLRSRSWTIGNVAINVTYENDEKMMHHFMWLGCEVLRCPCRTLVLPNVSFVQSFKVYNDFYSVQFSIWAYGSRMSDFWLFTLCMLSNEVCCSLVLSRLVCNDRWK